MPESYPMNGGDGTYSYTKNSQYQREASNSVKGMIEDAILQRLDVKSLVSARKTFCIADLGCSVGPNTFIAMQYVIDAVEKKDQTQGTDHGKMEFQVLFNDHVSNDFNTLFTTLPSERKYFAAGVPGSFYGRLFPSASLHFAHSAYALQWLTKVPEELLDKSSPAWNKGRIHYSGASDEVVKAYTRQFELDMETFLSARAEEVIAGGMVVIIMPGTPDGVHHSQVPANILFKFLGSSLMDMVNAGTIEEAQVDSFNLPIYSTTPSEITAVVERIGCFHIEKLEVNDPRAKNKIPVNAQSLVMHLRAGMEGVFSKHFGNIATAEMFDRTLQKAAEVAKAMESCSTESQLIAILKRK